MSEWQPIETAPKDGTRILVVSSAEFREDRRVHTDLWKNGSWWLSTASEPPTHWMPPPDPPEDKR